MFYASLKQDILIFYIIVLGCNAGIGKVTAHELSKKGARILMLCRNVEAAKRVAEEIKLDTGGEVFHF